jgi:TolB-like protein/thioredoxin-like negative regulator of GroEL
MSLFDELKRRNVFRVAIAYILLGWAVLQGADFLLDLAGAPEWVIRVFAIAGLVGFPFALFLAWAFELTPEGIKRESEVDRSQSITPSTGKTLNRVIIGLLVLIIVLMAVERMFFAGRSEPVAGSAETAMPKTIAVLPFSDLTQAQDQGWFADGLAEEIINALVRVPDLQVAARTSSFAYKGSKRPVSEIAGELGVAHILEGSVRSAGERIRVTAQLVRAGDGFHLWSQSYDRDVADMIGIQEDLARSIATALRTSMDPEALAKMAQVGTQSVEAYQAYLRGLQMRAEAETYSVGQRLALTRESYEHIERARSLDPGFFDAHLQAARFWKVELTPNLMETGLSGLEPEEMLREFNERIGQAIETARTETDRVRSLAERAMVDLRLREARRLFEDYLEIRPNDELARGEFLQLLLMLGDSKAAMSILSDWRHKLQSDVYSAIRYVNDAWRISDPDAASAALEATRRWPNSDQLFYQAHRTLLWAGRQREATEIARRYELLEPGGHPLVRARQACAEGNRAAAERQFEALDPDNNNNILAQRWLMLIMLGLSGEETEILRPLAQSGIPFQLSTFLTYPQFDPRPYPELMEVLEREGVERPPPLALPFKCPPPAQPSVAVLPFVNMSADPDNEYFSDGVAEEILNVLARIPDLKVSARTSAFSYKGGNATIAQIASDLGVNHVLEGSVRKAGEQVRVTAQLIEAGSGFHLWSETYDRELTNIFAIQDEIAQSIAEALKVQLLPPAEESNLTGTTNLEAYQLYLQGVNSWHLRSGESLERALSLLGRAVELDPQFARAHAYRALTWAVISDYTDRPPAQVRVETRRAAEAALALDPESVEAQTALLTPLLADSPAARAPLIERGAALIARNPGFATTHQWHATNLMEAGRVEEAVAAYRLALELDPRSRVTHQNLAVLLTALGQFGDAGQLLDNLESFAPDYWDGIQVRFQLHLLQGDREAAARVGERLAGILGRKRMTLPLYLDLFFDAERKAAAAAEIVEFPLDNWWDPDNPSLIDKFGLAHILAAAGAPQEALRVMKRLAADGGSYGISLVRVSQLTGDFACRPEVQAFYADLGQGPVSGAPDCP